MSNYPSLKFINNQHEKWRLATKESRLRIDNYHTFMHKQQMWSQDVKGERSRQNAVSHQYNLIRKYPAAMLGQSKNIDLSLSIRPVNLSEYTDGDSQEIAAQKIIEAMLINEKSNNVFYDGFSRLIDNGEAVFFISDAYESDKSCNKLPVIQLLDDTQDYSFDLNAKLKSFSDGDYFTVKFPVSVQTIRNAYGKKYDDCLNREGNILTEHYYKRPKKIKCYYHKETRQYIPVDCIKDDKWRDYDTEKYKVRIFKRVYVVKYLNDNDMPIVKNAPYFTHDCLPAVYLYALTERIKRRSEESHGSADYTIEQFPFAYGLINAQEMHNLIGSQIATQAKQSTGRITFVGRDNLQTDDDRKTFEEIGKTHGAIPVRNPDSIKIVDAPQITQTLLQAFISIREEIDALASTFVDVDANQAKNMPGVTLRQIVNQNNIVTNPIFEAHIDVINQVGKIILSSLPNLVVEERSYMIGDKSSSQNIIKVNEVVNGQIVNDINDICNKFSFKIEASPSDELDKANTISVITDMLKIIQSDPTLQGKAFLLLDMIPKLISSNYSDDLLKRISLMQDENYVKYINGEISEQQYRQLLAQQQQQQAMQQQAMQQSIMQMKQQEFMLSKEKADTDRFKAMSDASSKHMDSQTKRFEAEMTANLEHSQQAISEYQEHAKNYREDLRAQAEVTKATHESN